MLLPSWTVAYNNNSIIQCFGFLSSQTGAIKFVLYNITLFYFVTLYRRRRRYIGVTNTISLQRISR
jgi:hypothetical protein